MKTKLPSIKADKIPSWAVGVLAVSGVVIFGAVGYLIYKKFKSSSEKKEEKDVVDNATKELRDEIKNNAPSWPDSVYNTSANFIFNKLDGCETSSTELDVVKEVLRVVKNQTDWLKLIKAFGVRDVDDCGPWTGSTKYELGGLLKEQLDSTVYLSSEKIGNKTFNGSYKLSTLLTNELSARNIKY